MPRRSKPELVLWRAASPVAPVKVLVEVEGDFLSIINAPSGAPEINLGNVDITTLPKLVKDTRRAIASVSPLLSGGPAWVSVARRLIQEVPSLTQRDVERAFRAARVPPKQAMQTFLAAIQHQHVRSSTSYVLTLCASGLTVEEVVEKTSVVPMSPKTADAMVHGDTIGEAVVLPMLVVIDLTTGDVQTPEGIDRAAAIERAIEILRAQLASE